MRAQISTACRWLWDQPYLLLVLTALFWSGNVVLGRAMAFSLPPVTLAFMRWAGAFSVALAIAWPQLRQEAAAIRAGLPQLALLALTGVAINNASVYYGLHYTLAVNALVLQSFQPLVIALWAYVLLRERLTGRQILGLAVSLTGVFTVLSQGSLSALLHLRPNIGDLFVLLANFSYGIYSVLLRRRPPIHAMSFVTVTFGLGALMLLPAAGLELLHGATLRADWPNLLTVLYVALFPSLVAFICFNRGVELIGPNRAGVFFHLMPPFGAGLAMVFLGERPALFHAIGFVLILGGVALAAAAPKGHATP